MQKKTVVAIAAVIVAVSMLMGVLFAEPQVQSQTDSSLFTIFIRADGSVYPDVPIQRNGNVYTFTDDIYATMKIQRSNVILDGAGFTLYGPYNGTQVDVWVIGDGPSQLEKGVMAQYTIGVDLADKTIEGVTVRNLNIRNFSIGMYMWTKNNTVTGNYISENILGVLLSGSNTTITNNCIANNKQGLFFGFNNPSDIPTDLYIWQNGFVDNIKQINGCLCDEYPEDEEPHAWDNGKEGNYWSDYTGTDADGDGIGDTPYVVDIQNQDRYPMMHNPASAPTAQTPEVPVTAIALGASALIIVTVTAFALVRRRKSRKAL